MVDLHRRKVIRDIIGGVETEGIEFSADGRNLLITNEGGNTISVHDIATGKLVKTVETSKYGNRPRGIKLAPDGKSYVATLENSDAFLVLDKHFNIKKSVPTAKGPYGVAFDRGGKRLFIAAARDDVLQVFNAKTYQLIKTVPIAGKRCWHFSFTPDGKDILVACGRSDEVVVIDTRTLEPVKRIADKELPWGVVTYPKSYGSLDTP